MHSNKYLKYKYYLITEQVFKNSKANIPIVIIYPLC